MGGKVGNYEFGVIISNCKQLLELINHLKCGLYDDKLIKLSKLLLA